MPRTRFSWVLASFVVAGLMFAAVAVGQDRRHSGVIVRVAADTQTLTMREMGPWVGSGSTPRRWTIRLTSQTTIALASRSEDIQTTDAWPGDFKESPLAAADLHQGDFITVTATRSGGELIARSIAVVRPVRVSHSEAGGAATTGEAR